MNIYLIRHADPDYENDSLTELGVQEAEKLGEYLKSVPFTHLYSSPMGRAQKTMEPVARDRNLTPEILDWLHELNGFDGERWLWNINAAALSADKELAKHTESFMREQKENVLTEWNKCLAAHGYVYDESLYRVNGDVDEAPVVAMFAHAGLILTLLSGLVGWPLAHTYAYLDYKPSAITHFRLAGKNGTAALRMVSVNSRPHLDSIDNLGVSGGGRSGYFV